MKRFLSMRRYAAILCFLLVGVNTLCGQSARPIWRSYLSYRSTTLVMDASERVFGVANGCLYSISKKAPQEVRFYDRSSGLSDLDIAGLAYDPSTKTLLLYYRTGSIDLMTQGGITNLPAIAVNDRLQDKTLHRILMADGRAYLSGRFGIVVVDLISQVVLGTYFQGSESRDVACPAKGKLWAVRENRIVEGDEHDNLQDPSKWRALSTPTIGVDSIVQMASVGGVPLCKLKSGKLVKLNVEGGTEEVIADPTRSEAEYVDNIFVGDKATFANARGHSYLFRPASSEAIRCSSGSVAMLSCNADANTVWAATWEDGLARISIATPEAASISSLGLQFNSPADNNYFAAVAAHGRYYAVSGYRTVYRHGVPFMLKVMTPGGQWTHFDNAYINPLAATDVRDAVSLAVDPRDPKHYFIGTWGEGLIEFRDDKFFRRYDATNSPLVEASGIVDGHYYRVGSLTFDSKGNLWVTQAEVLGRTIVMLDDMGKWHSDFSFGQIKADNSYTKQVVYSNGVHWLGINHSQAGLYAFTDNGTPDNPSDDQSRYFSALRDRTGRDIPFGSYFALSIDRNGTLWLGADKGICSVAGASAVFSRQGDPVAARPVGGQEPNLYYILDDVRVNDIVVDRLNNKWIATEGDGLYLMNEDCTQIYRHYVVANSPLLSNSVRTLNLDESNGLLYVGTAYGLMTYDTGTEDFEGSTLKGLYAYPNPLRPDMPDGITISGLPAGGDVKITDVTGVLVYQATAIDTQVTWMARRDDGRRVSSGIYTVLVYDPASKASVSFRIAVVK